MDCREFLHRYSDYDDSLLSGSELASFQVHLAACVSCARYDRVLRKGRMLARQQRVAAAEDFMPRLHARLWQHRIERRRRFASPVTGGVAVALAAVTVLLSSLWFVSILDEAAADPLVAGSAAAPSVGVGLSDIRGGPEGASSARGWTVVPAMEAPAPREWASRRVDQRVPVAYSPLVTGPPTYRVQHAFQASATMSTGRTLD